MPASLAAGPEERLPLDLRLQSESPFPMSQPLPHLPFSCSFYVLCEKSISVAPKLQLDIQPQQAEIVNQFSSV